MSCTRCGMCCFPYAIGITENDDIARWLIYHGVMVESKPEGLMAIKGQSKCAMLVPNGDGTTACACYATRPEICATYLCERAKQE